MQYMDSAYSMKQLDGAGPIAYKQSFQHRSTHTYQSVNIMILIAHTSLYDTQYV